MSVGLLIITHGQLGQHLLDTSKGMMGMCPLQTKCLSVSQNCDPDEILDEAISKCQKLDSGDGVLVLTDMYGSTPSNIANRLIGKENVQVIAGINLPMLVRILNYPSLNLHEQVTKALTGGHDGILLCSQLDKQP